jgi:phosphoglycolate phosphatase
MPKKITNIIFDLDGTLIDSAPSILECFRLTLQANNIAPQVKVETSLIGPPLAKTLSILTGKHDPLELEKLISDFKDLYDNEGYKETIAYPEIISLIEGIQKLNIRLHIATNKRLAPTLLILKFLGWSNYFDSVYSIDSRHPSFSNKAEMLSSLLLDQYIDTNSCIYIGDRFEDMESALENQLEFIGALWGYQDQNLLDQKGLNGYRDIKLLIRDLVPRNL